MKRNSNSNFLALFATAATIQCLAIYCHHTSVDAFTTTQQSTSRPSLPITTLPAITTTASPAVLTVRSQRRYSSSSSSIRRHSSTTRVLKMASVLDDETATKIPQSASASSASPPSALHDGNTSDNNDKNKSLFIFQDSPFFEKLQEKIGRVDDDRIVFPEYDAGEVPRLYSSLQYTKAPLSSSSSSSLTATTTTTATHRTGSVVGATSLVAGTMIGAGILALPTATAPAGFLPSTAAMAVGWFYMTISGLLIAELCLNRLGMTGKPGSGMLELYDDALGPRWSKVGSITYFFLHYTLLVAYIAQGGTNLDAIVHSINNMGGAAAVAAAPGDSFLQQIPPQIIFATMCATGMYAATPAVIEKVNNVFVLVLSVAFIGIIAMGAQTADFGSLIDLSNQHPEKVADAFPIIFLSLVFHNIVPTVVNQLEGDRTKITTAIIGGTTVPALMFLAWNAVVLGNMDLSAASVNVDGGVDPVALLQQTVAAGSGGNAVLSNLLTTFSSLALVTSLIGFVYGLLDGWTDVFGLPTKGPAYDKWKAPLFGLVFVPPLALSLTSPDIFYHALEIGGAFGVSTLFLVLPPVMVWKQRYGDDQTPLITKPMVPLGKIPLGSMWKAAATLIVEQGADKLGVFDFMKEHLS